MLGVVMTKVIIVIFIIIAFTFNPCSKNTSTMQHQHEAGTRRPATGNRRSMFSVQCWVFSVQCSVLRSEHQAPSTEQETRAGSSRKTGACAKSASTEPVAVRMPGSRSFRVRVASSLPVVPWTHDHDT